MRSLASVSADVGERCRVQCVRADDSLDRRLLALSLPILQCTGTLILQCFPHQLLRQRARADHGPGVAKTRRRRSRFAFARACGRPPTSTSAVPRARGRANGVHSDTNGAQSKGSGSGAIEQCRCTDGRPVMIHQCQKLQAARRCCEACSVRPGRGLRAWPGHCCMGPARVLTLHAASSRSVIVCVHIPQCDDAIAPAARKRARRRVECDRRNGCAMALEDGEQRGRRAVHDAHLHAERRELRRRRDA